MRGRRGGPWLPRRAWDPRTPSKGDRLSVTPRRPNPSRARDRPRASGAEVKSEKPGAELQFERGVLVSQDSPLKGAPFSACRPRRPTACARRKRSRCDAVAKLVAFLLGGSRATYWEDCAPRTGQQYNSPVSLSSRLINSPYENPPPTTKRYSIRSRCSTFLYARRALCPRGTW